MAASASIEPRVWPRSRWLLAVLTVLLSQALGIFVLGGRALVLARRPTTLPSLQLSVAEPSGLLALSDPTLFALPHRQGFAGTAWLTIPDGEFQAPEWSELPRWLPVSAQALGTDFERFARTNERSTFSPISIPDLEWINPDILPPSTALTESRIQIGGGLAGRRLLLPTKLPSQRADELLADSVVQVLVDSHGRVFSAVVLSGNSSKADQLAQELAQSARFEPLQDDASSSRAGKGSLTMGTMTFVWKTLPTTNAPATAP